MGETFSTSQKFNVGDVIEVSLQEINYYESEDIIRGYAMRVKGASSHSKPYTKKEILRVAKDSGLLNVITTD